MSPKKDGAPANDPRHWEMFDYMPDADFRITHDYSTNTTRGLGIWLQIETKVSLETNVNADPNFLTDLHKALADLSPNGRSALYDFLVGKGAVAAGKDGVGLTILRAACGR